MVDMTMVIVIKSKSVQKNFKQPDTTTSTSMTTTSFLTEDWYCWPISVDRYFSRLREGFWKGFNWP